MNTDVPESLVVIAGKGIYPLLLVQSARAQGVNQISVIGFKKETDPAIEKYSDDMKWLRLGELQALVDAVKDYGSRHAVMAGQLTPTALFHVRLDSLAIAVMRRLRVRNAETIFGTVADLLRKNGTELLPAHKFMEKHMPAPGQLGRRSPTEQEEHDVQLGFRAAKATSALDIGQTVVVKDGIIVAVEAFEGTDETIRRAYKLCGHGAVVVKTAKTDHDMRFDIPVIGMTTLKLLKDVKASVLAVEAGRTIILERQKVIEEANRIGMCVLSIGD